MPANKKDPAGYFDTRPPELKSQSKPKPRPIKSCMTLLDPKRRPTVKTSKPKPKTKPKLAPTVLSMPEVFSEEAPEADHYVGLAKLNEDLRDHATRLTPREAKFIVRTYYMMQQQRIRTGLQLKRLDAPNEFLTHVNEQWALLEKVCKTGLDIFSRGHVMGEWAMKIIGIGPVLAAGCLAFVNLERHTCSKVWAFAGLDPGRDKRVKGKALPYNADFKTVCWKIGHSFKCFHRHKNDVYGQHVLARLAYEEPKNERGDYRDQALHIAKTKKFENKEIEAIYKSGKLPPGHLWSRAQRWSVKLYLSHYHAVGRFLVEGVVPPKPYIVVADAKHSNLIYPPNMPDGFKEAWDRADMHFRPEDDRSTEPVSELVS